MKAWRQRSNNRQALPKKTIPRLDGAQSGAQTDEGNRVKVWQIYSNGSKAWGPLSRQCPLLSRNANLGAESGIAAMVNGLPAKTGFVICVKRLPPRDPAFRSHRSNDSHIHGLRRSVLVLRYMPHTH